MIFTLSHLATQEVKLLAESFVESEIYKLIPTHFPQSLTFSLIVFSLIVNSGREADFFILQHALVLFKKKVRIWTPGKGPGRASSEALPCPFFVSLSIPVV